MISNCKRLNFCNFSAHFPPLVRPHKTLIIFLFRDIFHGRIPTQIPANSPNRQPFQGGNTGIFWGGILHFLLKFSGFCVSFSSSRHETGEVSER